MLRKRTILILVLLGSLFLIIACLCTLLYFRISVPANKLKKEASRYEEYKLSFSRLPVGMSKEKINELKSTKNNDHVEAATKFGVCGLINEQNVVDALKEKKLVHLKETNYWRIKELEDSLPYVTPDTVKLLQIIGKRFQENLQKNNLPLYRFTISSVLRTDEMQKRLSRKNRNATKNISSHQFGTSVDILFKEFDYTSENPLEFNFLKKYGYGPEFKKSEFDELGIIYSQCLRKILGETLLELQREGLCFVIYEVRQPVFHVTLARKM